MDPKLHKMAPAGAKMMSKWSQNYTKWHPQALPVGSRWPQRAHIGNKRVQNGHMEAPRGPKMAQEGSKMAPRNTKIAS